MMIKWCLHLKLRSSSTYDALRSSRCLTLPTERTLRDYTHHFKGTVGFNAKLDEQLFRESNVANLEDWQKYVVLMFDEMKVKEDLVYDKRTGELIGFVNLGDINDHLQHFEQTLSSDISDQPNLASSMLVFMVKGIFTRLEFPYAQLNSCIPSCGIPFDVSRHLDSRCLFLHVMAQDQITSFFDYTRPEKMLSTRQGQVNARYIKHNKRAKE